MALVSVVIPTYNRPDYLDGAIQTALHQTYEALEVVVVDDGSENQYAQEIVDSYGDRVRLIQHENNKGLSAARNTGINQSNGDYIAFLDDDDRWHKTKIERQVQILEENGDVGLVTCLVASVTPDRELIHCESTAPSGNCSKEMLICNQIGTPSRILVRRECFDDVGDFDESLPTKQDWDFYIRLCQRWQIGAVTDHLCFRTVHESMSSSPAAAARDNEKVLRKHEERMRRKDCWQEARSEVAGRVGRAYLKQGELSSARKELKYTVRHSPSIMRVGLFLLSFTHPTVVRTCLKAKRKVSLSLSDCSEAVFDGVIFEDNTI